MTCTRRKCVENIDTSRFGSPIWDVCKKAAYIIQDSIHWIVGNGKRIKIWHDRLGSNFPTNFRQELNDLKELFVCNNINTLYDISS